MQSPFLWLAIYKSSTRGCHFGEGWLIDRHQCRREQRIFVVISHLKSPYLTWTQPHHGYVRSTEVLFPAPRNAMFDAVPNSQTPHWYCAGGHDYLQLIQLICICIYIYIHIQVETIGFGDHITPATIVDIIARCRMFKVGFELALCYCSCCCLRCQDQLWPAHDT